MKRIMAVVVASVLSVFLMVSLPTVAQAQGKVQVVSTDPFSSYLTVLPSVGVQAAPEGVAITPDGTRAYVTNEGSNSVSVIRLSDNTILTTISDGIGGNPEKIVIRPDGKRAYTTNENTGDISVIDTNPLDPPNLYNHVIANLAGFTSPEGIAINPCGDRAVVTDEVANVVRVLDITSDPPTIIGSIGVGTGPEGIAITPDGSRAYVTNAGSNNVTAINLAAGSVIATIGTGANPQGIAFTPDGRLAFVANNCDDNVSVLDTDPVSGTYNTELLPRIGVQGRPYGVAVAGTRCYVTNNGAGSLSVIDTLTRTLVTNVGLLPPSEPLGIAITPNGTRAYIADQVDALIVACPMPGGEH